MMNFRILMFLALLGLVLQAEAQDSTAAHPSLHFGGYVKHLHNVNFVDRVEQLTTTDLLHHRLNAKLQWGAHWSVRAELRNRFFHGEGVRAVPGFGRAINADTGLVRMTALWVDRPGAVGISTFDRALVRYAASKWELSIGRQRINWGVNTIWNPNDLFNAYNFLDFDYEERPGSDAVRLLWFPSSRNTLEVAYKPGENDHDHIGAMLFRSGIGMFDVQALAGLYHSDVVLGAGWAGNILKAGFKGEASYFHPREHPADTSGVFTASIALDQTFKGDWYLSAAYLYNSRSDVELGTASALTSAPLSAKRLLPFHHGIVARGNKSLSPLASVSFTMLYSPYRSTLLLFPTVAYNIATNFDLDLTVQSLLADDDGVWAVQNNAVYLRIRWSY